MAEFTVILEKDAPKPARSSGRLVNRMREYDAYLLQIKKGQVGALTAGEKETPRGIALRISRAGKRIDRPVETWVVERTAYFKLV